MCDGYPVISLIIPVYNEDEGRFFRALDSALTAVADQGEVIVVDDGSDAFPDLDGRFGKALSDGTLRVFHQENAGVSAARNRGLLEARGIWTGFLDSDDCLSPDYAEVLLPALRDECDLILFDAEIVEGGLSKKVRLIPDAGEGMLSGEEFSLFRLDVLSNGYEKRKGRTYLQAVGNKLFRKSRIEECRLRFPEDMKIAEDCAFLLAYLFSGELKTMYLSRALYLRTIRPGSAVHVRHPDIRDNDRAFLREIRHALSGRPVEGSIRRALIKRTVICAFGVLQYDLAHPDHPDQAGKRAAKMRAFLKETPYRQALREADPGWFPRKDRLRLLLLRTHCCRLYLFLQGRLL